MDKAALRAKIIEGDGREDIRFEFKGEWFRIKQLTVAQARAIEAASKGKDGLDTHAAAMRQLCASLHSDAGEKVFDYKSDKDLLDNLNAGVGGFLEAYFKAHKELTERTPHDAQATF